MSEGSTPLASTKVEITAPLDRLKTDLAAAQEEVRAAAERMQKEAARASAELDFQVPQRPKNMFEPLTETERFDIIRESSKRTADQIRTGFEQADTSIGKLRPGLAFLSRGLTAVGADGAATGVSLANSFAGVAGKVGVAGAAIAALTLIVVAYQKVAAAVNATNDEMLANAYAQAKESDKEQRINDAAKAASDAAILRSRRTTQEIVDARAELQRLDATINGTRNSIATLNADPDKIAGVTGNTQSTKESLENTLTTMVARRQALAKAVADLQVEQERRVTEVVTEESKKQQEANAETARQLALDLRKASDDALAAARGGGLTAALKALADEESRERDKMISDTTKKAEDARRAINETLKGQDLPELKGPVEIDREQLAKDLATLHDTYLAKRQKLQTEIVAQQIETEEKLLAEVATTNAAIDTLYQDQFDQRVAQLREQRKTEVDEATRKHEDVAAINAKYDALERQNDAERVKFHKDALREISEMAVQAQLDLRQATAATGIDPTDRVAGIERQRTASAESLRAQMEATKRERILAHKDIVGLDAVLADQLAANDAKYDKERVDLAAATNKSIRDATAEFNLQILDINADFTTKRLDEIRLRHARELEEAKKSGADLKALAVKQELELEAAVADAQQLRQERIQTLEYRINDPNTDFLAGFALQAQKAQEEMKTLGQVGADVYTDLRSGFAGLLKTAITDSKHLGDAFVAMLDRIYSKLLDIVTDRATGAFLAALGIGVNTTNVGANDYRGEVSPEMASEGVGRLKSLRMNPAHADRRREVTIIHAPENTTSRTEESSSGNLDQFDVYIESVVENSITNGGRVARALRNSNGVRPLPIRRS